MLNVYKKGMKCQTFLGGKLEKKSFLFFIWLNSVSASEKLVLSMQGKKQTADNIFWGFFWWWGVWGGGAMGGSRRGGGLLLFLVGFVIIFWVCLFYCVFVLFF